MKATPTCTQITPSPMRLNYARKTILHQPKAIQSTQDYATQTTVKTKQLECQAHPPSVPILDCSSSTTPVLKASCMPQTHAEDQNLAFNPPTMIHGARHLPWIQGPNGQLLAFCDPSNINITENGNIECAGTSEQNALPPRVIEISSDSNLDLDSPYSPASPLMVEDKECQTEVFFLF